MKSENEQLPKQKKITQIQEVIEKLTCPVCNHKVLIRNDNLIKCLNEKCETEFPIITGVPILINESDSIFSIKDYDKIPVNKIKNGAKEIVKNILKIFPSLSNNLSYKKNFKLLEELLSIRPNPKILIIGGGTITTNTEDIKRIMKPENIVIESDVYIGPRTQIVIDGHHIPFEDNTFDLVIFQAVLEHVADPPMCAKEAHRVLKSDGIVFSATPFMQQVHMREYDFTRYTHLGHRRLFRSFNEIESGVFAGTGVALGWSIKYFVGSLSSNKYIRIILQQFVTLMFFWLKYIDYIIRRNNGIYDGASGFYFIGRKTNDILSDKELIKLYRGY